MSIENMMNQQITTRELKAVLNYAAQSKDSVMIYGSSGVGKSQIVSQFADEYAPEYTGKNVIDIRLATEVPENLRGIAVPMQTDDEGGFETVYAIPSFWPKDENWKGVIFFDELTSAPPSMQTTAYQALLDRCIGQLKFPKGAVVAAAGNRSGEGLVYEILPAVRNRMILTEIVSDLDVWVEDYAIENGVHGSILAYLEQEPTNFNQDPETVQGAAFATSRSWEKASRLVKSMEAGEISKNLGMKLLAGMVGDGPATAFQTYYDIGYKLPKPKDILNGKNPQFNVDDDARVSASFILAYNCLTTWGSGFSKAEISDADLNKSLENMASYLKTHIPEEIEMMTGMVVKGRQFALANKDKHKRRVHLQMLKEPTIGKIIREQAELMAETE